MQFNFAFVAGLLAATPVLASIPVTIYEGDSGQGFSKTLTLQPGICQNLGPSLQTRVSSFLKPQYARCRIYKNAGCTGPSTAYYDNNAFICYLDDEYEDKVMSMSCT